MATFNNFDWDTSVIENDGTISEFKLINIIYGRNYSGKTTISRIIRALETGHLSEKYLNPEFIVNIHNNQNVAHTNLKNHNQVIRVFNEDFVRENLNFIYNPDDSIKSFAIGSINNDIEIKVKEKEVTLGSELLNTGLYAELLVKQNSLNNSSTTASQAKISLNNKLDKKATDRNSGIKYSKHNYDQNYTITKLQKDINLTLETSLVALDEDQIQSFRLLLKEEQKPEISETVLHSLKLIDLNKNAKELVEKKISITTAIQDLLNDSLLEDWARKGISLHKNKRTECGFCGNKIPHELWSKLDNHFNKESENLREDIEQLIIKIDNENLGMDTYLSIDPKSFYSKFTSEIQSLKDSLALELKEYKKNLKSIKKQLSERLLKISQPTVFELTNDNSEALSSIVSSYEDLRIKSNLFTNTLSSTQANAKNKLRLQEVVEFIEAINYQSELENVNSLATEESSQKLAFDETNKNIKTLKQEIQSLKDQLKDEGKAADRVNHYLNNYFGHAFLSIKAIEDETGKRFEVIRKNIKAHHLSEGECSLIAFCYFIAKLDDVETKNSKPIVWIDDPISSLDSNHIFFIFSLISTEIVQPDSFKQLFISTHNLDFLKYLKRISDNSSHHRAHFIIERNYENSHLKKMPSYLKDYVTEFNFLFKELYNCAKADGSHEENHDCFYNFGNNARKFLEAFLFYKYPNSTSDKLKLEKFFGDLNSPIITDRINNEYSHLGGMLDRSMSPVDVPEMKKVARTILLKINSNDSDQFEALCESINKVASL